MKGQATKTETGLPDSRPPRDLRVLIVDDDEDIRLTLSDAVEHLGFACSTAENGVEAWELHRACPFEVILSDWMMPEMTGPELCRKIRVEDRETYTYFILVSALGDRAHFVRGLREGADDFLSKPIDLEELEARLESAARVAAVNRRLLNRNGSLRLESERAIQVSRIDPLTGVNNRVSLERDLAEAMALGKRYQHKYSVGVCDVDLFKQYNDSFGHLAGDDALRRIAQAMQASLREGDRLYRYGGEEFLVILPQQALKNAATAMDRLRCHVEELGISSHKDKPGEFVTVSVGVAELDLDKDVSAADWLGRADAALYRAKRHGRNRVALDAGGAEV